MILKVCLFTNVHEIMIDRSLKVIRRLPEFEDSEALSEPRFLLPSTQNL